MANYNNMLATNIRESKVIRESADEQYDYFSSLFVKQKFTTIVKNFIMHGTLVHCITCNSPHLHISAGTNMALVYLNYSQEHDLWRVPFLKPVVVLMFLRKLILPPLRLDGTAPLMSNKLLCLFYLPNVDT